MDKFIRLHDQRGCVVIINVDQVSYVHRKEGESLTKVRMIGESSEGTIYTQEPVEEVFALLTNDRKYFLERDREARRRERDQRVSKAAEDDCTPVVDLTAGASTVKITSTGHVDTPVSDIITIAGGNATTTLQVNSNGVEMFSGSVYPYGAIVSSGSAVGVLEK